MAKTFYTSGTGSQQTLTGSQNEKVAVYQTLADAEADLANLEAGQIVATPDTGDENAQPVDVVESGNMHAVTSNAVANSNAMPVNSVTSGNLHSVTSNAVYNATRKLPITQIAWGRGSVQYLKISNLFGGSQSCNSYMMLARAGETILISIGSNDNETMASPKIKRLLNAHSKIAGFTYSGSDLYVAIEAWSHNVYIAQITGNINANIMVSVATASEYNAGTPITIET